MSNSSDNSMSKETKKRNRVPLSCANCRRKKIKCDRTKPRCKVCEAHNDEECSYFESNKKVSPGRTDEPKLAIERDLSGTNLVRHGQIPVVQSTVPFDPRLSAAASSAAAAAAAAAADNANQNAIIESLQQKIKALEDKLHSRGNLSLHSTRIHGNTFLSRLLLQLGVKESEKIQPYSGVSDKNLIQKTLNNAGPLVWMTIVIKDPFASLICKCVFNSSRHILTDFHKRALAAKSNLMKSSDQSNHVEKINLVETIVPLLPPPKAIWKFIERFFRYVYPFLPYLDERAFIHDIERLLGTAKDQGIFQEFPVNTLFVTQATDYATIGILMIVMMFSYETLCNNTGNIAESYLSESDLYLIAHKPSDKFVKYTQMCLDEFVMFRKCPLPVLQCAMLLREYQKFDGCDCFGDSDSQVYTGLLVQMAISKGIHIDSISEEMDIARTYNKRAQLKRKLWYGLISADNYQYMQTSAMPLIQLDYYNTALPIFDPYLSNSLDLEMEKVSIDMLRCKFQIECKMKVLADMVCKMNTEPSVYELLNLIDDLFATIKQSIGTLDSILDGKHGGVHSVKVQKVGHLVIYMNFLTLVEPVLMHILCQFQKLKHSKMCEFVHDKLLSIWLPVLSRVPELVIHSDKFFGPGFDLFLVPAIEVFLQKGLVFFSSTYLKCNTMIKKAEVTNTKGNKTELIEAALYLQKHVLFEIFHGIYVPTLQILSKKFFYAWRLYKAHTLIFRSFLDGSVPSPFLIGLFNYFECMTVDKIKMLSQTTDWKNYISQSSPPSWFVTWQKNLDNFIYDDSLEKDALETFSMAASNAMVRASSELAETDSAAGDELEADKWFARLYTKFTEKNYPGYQNPNGPASVTVSVLDRPLEMKYNSNQSEVPKQDAYSIPTPKMGLFGNEIEMTEDFFGTIPPLDLERIFATMVAEDGTWT